MRILYVFSGYPRIYHFFDQCILRELSNLPNIEVKACQPSCELSTFQSMCTKFQPHIVFTMLGDFLPRYTLEWIKQQSFYSLLWLTEDPYFTDRSINIIPYFDFVFSIDSGAVDYYKKLGYQSIYHLPLGTDPTVYFPKPDIQKTNDICFIGHSYPERIRLISLLLKETPYKIQVIGKWKRALFPKIPTKNLNLIHHWVYPQKAADYYLKSKIVLNTYRSYNYKVNQNGANIINRSVNNRTFDIASCGTFQLTQWIDELSQNFEDGKEIVSFKTDDDLINEVNNYLSNTEERELISNGGRKRVLSQHTFLHRLNKMMEIVKK
ncbi:glycosyltransferase [Priestia aryabhattai]|uniref:CgeB family protein n=1 Tax=Priestia TaxID=2800373 RepID=UPI003983639E